MTASERIRAAREARAKLDTPIERILFDNDPANGTFAERIVAMSEETEASQCGSHATAGVSPVAPQSPGHILAPGTEAGTVLQCVRCRGRFSPDYVFMVNGSTCCWDCFLSPGIDTLTRP